MQLGAAGATVYVTGRTSRAARSEMNRPETIEETAARQKWSYSITSSARPSRESGTVMPSAFAVFKLTTNWILVACYTGRSAGFSPFKMRPV